MFDNLREDAASGYEEQGKYQSASGPISGGRQKRVLGMTSFQRFIIAFMLMLAVCMIGTMVMFVTGKMGI